METRIPARAKVRVKKTEWVYHGTVFSVRRDVVIEPGGIEATREIVHHTGSVVLLPVFEDGRILLVRQFRYAAKQFLWELVAGRIEPGERPLAAARRELIEETGYTARRFRRLLSFYPTPGFVGEVMHLYEVSGLRAGDARPEADEAITTRRFSLRQLLSMIRRGTLCDAKSIVGTLYFARSVARSRPRTTCL